MVEADVKIAPAWVRMAAVIIRRLPAGRFRLINRICHRPPPAFLMSMPAEMGAFTFLCDLRDTISREVCFIGRYEPLETSIVESVLGPGMTFVDVGANWGYFTLFAAHLVGKGGKVISLEPDPRLYQVLHNSIIRNRLEQVVTLQVAAADEEGMLSLAGYDESGNNFGISRIVSKARDEATFEVKGRRLDDLLDEYGFESIDLLKMDIEGYEGYALKGLHNYLRHQRIRMLLMELHPAEIEKHGHSVTSIIGNLRDFGYCPWQLDHSKDSTRRAAYSKYLDIKTFLRPLNENKDLGDWPHVLWTMPGLEPQW